MYINTDDNSGGLTFANGTTNLGGSTQYGLIMDFICFYGGSTHDFQVPVYMPYLDTRNNKFVESYEVYYKSDRSDNRLEWT